MQNPILLKAWSMLWLVNFFYLCHGFGRLDMRPSFLFTYMHMHIYMVVAAVAAAQNVENLH